MQSTLVIGQTSPQAAVPLVKPIGWCFATDTAPALVQGGIGKTQVTVMPDNRIGGSVEYAMR